MSTRGDHHGLNEAETATFDRLDAEAVQLNGRRYRFPSLADADTFGTFTVQAADKYDAVYLATLATRDGDAFWKS